MNYVIPKRYYDLIQLLNKINAIPRSLTVIYTYHLHQNTNLVLTFLHSLYTHT